MAERFVSNITLPKAVMEGATGCICAERACSVVMGLTKLTNVHVERSASLPARKPRVHSKRLCEPAMIVEFVFLQQSFYHCLLYFISLQVHIAKVIWVRNWEQCAHRRVLNVSSRRLIC